MSYSVNDLNRAADKIKNSIDARSEKRAQKVAESIQNTGIFTLLFIFPLIWFGASGTFSVIFSLFTGGINSGDGGALLLYFVGRSRYRGEKNHHADN